MPARRQAGVMTQGQSIYSLRTGAAWDSQSLLACFSAHMYQPFSEAAPSMPHEAVALGTAFLVAVGSTKLAGT